MSTVLWTLWKIQIGGGGTLKRHMCVYDEHVSLREGGREGGSLVDYFTSLCLLCWWWSGRWLEGSARS